MRKKYGFLKEILAVLLTAALLVSVVGCTGGESDPAVKETLPKETEVSASVRTESTETSPEAPTDPSVTDQPEQENEALMILRQQLKEEDRSFAMAYLGYLTYDYGTLWDFIDGLGDAVLEKMPFLQQIPETNMIATASQGEVYCFIPTDPEAVIEIFTDATGEEVYYECTSEAPYLLVCNSAESPDCYVTITDTLDGEAFTTWWYPKLDEYLYAEQPRYASGTTGALDISPYNELLLTFYEDMQTNSGWNKLTKADLLDTTWYWDGYTQGDNYYEYRITFHEDTADVRWNPGYGETHEYMDAEWDYEDDAAVGVLTIDFGEFAGVRKYNLLADWGASMLYIAVDATGEDLTWDSEPQYRFLILAREETSPIALAGTWERTQTEVDGYIEESPAGEVMIRITGTAEADLRIDYEDTQSADRSFEDRAIFIMPGEDFMGVGEVEWIGQINYTGESANESYMLALVDGELILRHIFTVDGAPCAGYETFRRIN